MRFKFCLPRYLPARILFQHTQTFSKEYADGVAHVISQNLMTKEKVTLKLSESTKNIKKLTHPVANDLPQRAIVGLQNAIIQCTKTTPKELQGDADQKFEQLRQRKMPAPPSEVRKARENEEFRNYKWKPLSFKTREHCASYALATLPMHYAEAKFVLDELDRFNVQPESILDFGSGAGGVFWAARQKWNHCLRDYSMVDPSELMSHFAMDIMRNQETNVLIAPYVNFRKSIVGATNKKYDIVIAQRVLSEFDSHHSRTDVIKLLWERTNKYLILIESNSSEHFKALMHARAFILLMGIKFDTKSLAKYLLRNGIMTTEINNMLDNPDASLLEKYNFLKSKNINVPTELEFGHVVAPCPHDSGCPLQTTDESKLVCSHMVRYKEIRTDGRTKSSDRSGNLKSNFTYIILCKGERPTGHQFARILKKTDSSNCVNCKLCTSFEGLQHFTITKSAKDLYKKVRYTKQGCLFPLEENVVSSDSDFHFVREIVNEALNKG